MRRGWLTLKQKCFKFMLETREVRVLSQVQWQAFPHTRACSTETLVTQYVSFHGRTTVSVDWRRLNVAVFGLRLGLDSASGWFVVMHTYLYCFLLSPCHLCVCVCVCVVNAAVRISTPKFSNDDDLDDIFRPQQRLCVPHANQKPMLYWCGFMTKLRRSGVEPSARLQTKLDAWLRLATKALHEEGRCETPGCRRRAVGDSLLCSRCRESSQPPTESATCRTPSCHNRPLTRNGLCLRCSSAPFQRMPVLQYGGQSSTGLDGYLDDADCHDEARHPMTVYARLWTYGGSQFLLLCIDSNVALSQNSIFF